jgi:hypothetical protein
VVGVAVAVALIAAAATAAPRAAVAVEAAVGALGFPGSESRTRIKHQSRVPS